VTTCVGCEEQRLGMRCVRCGREYEMLAFEMLVESIGPDGVVICETTGCYGSTVYDMMIGDPCLQFIICDACFVELRSGMFERKPDTCETGPEAESKTEAESTSSTMNFMLDASGEARNT